ncbi:MAG TPA: diacylglycerol kinase family protein [Polyangiales bacterium]|nr:diacylglycerol kinase family protein [Polyangiales bacterium]
MQTAIIVNRNAGSMRRDPRLAERMRRMCGRHVALRVTETLGDLHSAIDEVAHEGATTVGVLGGDGTASATLTALWHAYGEKPKPKIAFLRGGTMNTVASSMGISHKQPSELLRRALGATESPELARVRSRPVMVVGDRLGFLFGTGVWHGYLAETYKHGQPTRLINATTLVRAISSAAVNGETFQRIFQPTPIEVRFAGGTWAAHPYLTVAAGTVADVGFGFRPFHRVFQTERGFQILAIQGGPVAVLKDLPRVFLARGFDPRTAHDQITPWAELRSPQGTFGYSVDGDVCSAQGSLRLELGPVFEFLRI